MLTRATVLFKINLLLRYIRPFTPIFRSMVCHVSACHTALYVVVYSCLSWSATCQPVIQYYMLLCTLTACPGLWSATCQPVILFVVVYSCLSWSMVCHVSACHSASSHLLPLSLPASATLWAWRSVITTFIFLIFLKKVQQILIEQKYFM